MFFRKFLLCLAVTGLFWLTSCESLPQTQAEPASLNIDLQRPSQTASPIPSRTPFPALLATATASDTPTLLPSSTLAPSETPIPSFTPQPTDGPAPDEYYITGISGHRQNYSISCEASAAADWAAFFGEEAYESTIQFELPITDNPDTGFVGNVNDPWGQVPPYSYGVYAEPIAQTLRDLYELPAQAVKNFSLQEIKDEIANDQPVLVWVIGNMVVGIPAEYTDSAGNTVIVAAYEHAVILTGYSQDSIRYLNNGRFFEVPTDVFLNSWAVLENMAVYYD
jgi:uncharacterized protein YvpB